jgi:uncharacterized heparinase superfamily protein
MGAMESQATTGRRLKAGILSLAFGNPLYSMMLGFSGPRDLALVPPDVWPGDGERGAAMIVGRYHFAGQTVQTENPLLLPPGVGTEFLAGLHGCEWLRDLRAVGTDAARRHARLLVASWVERHDRWQELAWRPDVLGRRLASWLGTHDFFCSSADDLFRARVFASLTRQVRHLGRVLPGELTGAALIAAAKGLLYGSLALPEGEGRHLQALRLIEKEVARQVLPDGGHVQRCPSIHLAVLRDLVDVRGCLAAARIAIPEALQHAIDRMAPALRFFRHGDGALALFNGGQEGDADLIEAVLTLADARGRPLRSARHSGFERVLAGRTLVIMDAGAPPPAGFDDRAHAGPLSFELSVGRERMIVNCGASLESGSEEALAWRRALRGTAAHSTLTLGDSNAFTLADDGGIRRRPDEVTVERQEADGAFLIEASHDGYAPTWGLTHLRRLYVAAGGDDIRGEDALSAAEPVTAGLPFAVRFHLHPSVQASVIQNGAVALLRTASGAGFRLRASGGHLAIEESIYAGQGEDRRRSAQIVVAGTTGPGTAAAVVKWALRRERR